MRKLIAAASVLVGSLAVSAVNAQSFDYHVYLNSDLRAVTGCTVTAVDGQSFSGIDQRLTATVEGSPPIVTELRLAGCAGGDFAAGTVIGGNFPVGLNNGVALGGGAFADVIELSVSRQQIPGALPMVSIGFGAQDGAVIDDGVFTRNGLPGGPPMAIGTVQLIPTAGFVGLLLLGTLLLVLGGLAMRRNGRLTRVLLVSACLVFSAAAWAANFVLDGEVGDWSGITPLATDQAGDSPLSGTDIVAAFAVDDDPDLRFRIDVVDAENRPPVAVDDAYSVLEDQLLSVAAPGVLVNDSDPDGNAVTAQGFTAPNFGVLNAEEDGSFTFAGLADENGTASFSYFAFDGQVPSLTAATVTVTVTPVNDAPGFSASNPPAVNEDAGAQSLSFASFSPGPANESAQSVLAYAVSAVSNAALFAAGPTIANDGTLSYTPAANANGSSQFTVTVQDDGGTANGGVDTSAPQTFTITVNAVNDAPSFSAGPDQTVNEDAGAQVVNPWATAISPGPADEAGQVLSFNVTNNSNPALFSVPPAVTATGALSYTPAANANGTATITIALMDDGGTANGGVDTSATQSFSITVNPINDAPSFVAGPDQVVNEDAGAQTITPWATAIDDGEPEATQGLSFQVTNNTNAALFAAGPTISPTGVLSFTSADDANGTATISIQLMDDGGTANGGDDTSATQDFVITVTAVNDAPSYTVGPDQTVLEDAGPQVVAPWATAISTGPADEAGQMVTFNVTDNSNPALFAAGPAVSPTGALSYTPAANANGSATITLTLMDDGGTANGGVDTSTEQTFVINVTPVNDEPSFVAGPNQVINEDAGAQVVSPWATAISAGPGDESGQSLSFNVSNDNNALFLVQPTLSSNGALSYTAAANANGVANVTLNLMDDGGTANGGDDSSPNQGFTITVNAVNDAPVNTVPGAQSVDEDGLLAFGGPALISVSDLDIAAGALTVNLSVNDGTLDVTAAGSALVNSNGTAAVQISGSPADVNASLASLGYSPDADYNGADTLSVSSNDNGNTGSGGPQTDLDSIAITVNPINDAPVNTVPGTQTVAGGVLTFSTANGNAVSVSDVDADPANVQVDVSVAGGTLSAVVTPGVTISNNGSAAVTLLGQQTAVNTALDGLTYSAGGAGSDTLLVLSSDLGNSGAGGPLSDSDTVTLLIDEPPTVGVMPLNGATSASGPTVNLLFSENVDLQTGAVTIACAPSGAGFSLPAAALGVPGFNVIGAPAVTGQPGDTCTITVVSTLVTDSDLIDPPNELDGDNSGDSVDGDADNFVSTYTVDTAPSFVSSSPITGATVANNIDLSVTFSEPVNFSAASFSIDCPGGSPFAGGFAVSGSGTTTATINPTGPLPAGACVLTAIAAQISDVDTFDPPQNPVSNTIVNLTVDAAPTFVSATPAAAAAVGTGQTVSFTFDENVANLGGAITLDCGAAVAGTISGGGTPTLTFTPTNPLTPGTSCTATAVAAQIGDSDAVDPPQNPVADVLRSFTVDTAPSVLTTAPLDAAIDVSLLGVVTYTFSEPVNFVVGSFTYVCNGNPVAFNAAGDGSATATLTPIAILPTNVPCTVTALAAGITDVDAGDPPDNLTANVAISFTTVDDSPPSVTTSPMDGATVASNSNVNVTFNEPVTLTGAWLELDCSLSGVRTSTGELTGSGIIIIENTPDLVYTIDPTANFASGESCTLTIAAANVADNDAIDPPNNMLTDYVASFSVDAAPAVTTTVPADAATDVALAATITVNFSEPVNVAANGIALDCAGPVSFNAGPLPASNVTSVVLTPSSPLPASTVCSGSVLGTSVTDVDAIDPPNAAANFSWSFTTIDVAPEVLSTTPANGAIDVNPSSSITVNFSESVNFDTTANAANTSFDLECPSGSPVNFTVATASPASSAVLNPLDSAIAGATCTLIVRAAGITDADLVDPPNSMAADFNASFSFGALAENDAYTVTPHLTLGIGTGSPQGGGVLANDLIGGGSVTGFGFAPACTGTAPGNPLDAGAANGRLTLNANGSFSYEPPAGVANATRTFCYTVTGGDTANVAFTLQNTELVWFIDPFYTTVNGAPNGAANGTQSRPFDFLTEAAAVDTAGDTLFVKFYPATAYPCEITLEANARMIGEGASGTLAAHSGITPVAGSAFPTLTNSDLNWPGLTAAAANCVTTGTNNVIRGFRFSNVGPGNTALVANAFGTLTVADARITTNGSALNLSNGQANVTLVEVGSSGTSLAETIRLNDLSGTVDLGNGFISGGPAGHTTFLATGAMGTVSYSGLLSKNTAGTLVEISGAGAGSITLSGTLACSNSCGSGAGDHGILVSGRTGGTISFAGNPQLTPSSPTAAVNLVNNSGTTINFNPPGVMVLGTTTFELVGPGLVASGGGTLNLNGSINIATNGARALDIDGMTVAGSMNGGIITNGALGAGIPVIEITNSLSPAGITFGQQLLLDHDDAGDTGGGIRLAGNTGTYGFTGGANSVTTGASPAVELTSNTGATINFSGGGLSISSTSGAAFTATGGGTVTVQGTGNAITTTTGAAVNIGSTTIGGAGVSFASINSTAASATPVITLSGTGAGPFSVTGTGAGGSGGTIDNKTGDAIVLSNTGGLVTLNQMIIEDIGNMGGVSNTVSGHDAIQGLNVNGGLSLTGTVIRRISDNAIHGGDHLNPATSTVWNGLTLSGVTIEDTNRYHVASRGDANNEGSVRIVGLRGTVNVSSSTFRRGAEFLDVFVTAGTLNMDVTGSAFQNAYKEFVAGDNSPIASVGNHCIDVIVQGAGAANVTLGDRILPAEANSFLNCRVGSVRVVNDTGSTGTSTFVVARNTFTVNDGSSGIFCNPGCQSADFDFPMGGVLGWNLGTGTVNTVIENNSFTDVTNASGGVGQLTLISEGGGLHQSLVQNNTFIRPGNAPMLVQSRNVVGSNVRLRALNNTVTGGSSLCTTDASCAGGYPAPGLRTLFDTSGGATMELTLDNNQFAGHDQGFDPGETVEVRALAPTGGQVCTNLTNNRAEDGYSLETGAGSISTVGAGSCPIGAPSANCQALLGSRGNLGGSNSLITNPPFVRVLGSPVSVVGVACALPTGGPF